MSWFWHIFSLKGAQTCSPGTAVGEGLTQESAAEMGLVPGTAVAASLIDAHAGGLGELLWYCFFFRSHLEADGANDAIAVNAR